MACKQVRIDDPEFAIEKQKHLIVVKGGPHIAAFQSDIEWNPELRTLSFFMDYYRGKDLERIILMMRAAE
jgi:hypothetical protein